MCKCVRDDCNAESIVISAYDCETSPIDGDEALLNDAYKYILICLNYYQFGIGVFDYRLDGPDTINMALDHVTPDAVTIA